MLQFEHVTGKPVFVNPWRVSFVISREAGKVLVCFSGLADDHVVVMGTVDDVQHQIASALKE